MAGAKPQKTATPGIYRRGDGYTFSYRDSRRVQRWKTAPTLAQARTLRERTRADVSRGVHAEIADTGFTAYATEWLANYQGRTNRGFREATRKSYRKHLERAGAYFEGERGLKLAEVTPRDVRAFLRWVPDTYPEVKGTATVKRHLATLKALFSDAVADGDLERNPAREVRVSTAATELLDPTERRALTMAEATALLDAAHEPWRLQIAFMLHTGMRIGEVAELRWGDVSFGKRTVVKVRRQLANDGTVTVPKSRRGHRDIPLSAELAADLWRAQGRAEELVFPNTVGRHLSKTGFLSRVIRPIAHEAGIEWAAQVGSHTLRHTCASILFASGLNPLQVSRWLGHASPDFTLRTYIHLMDDGLGTPDVLGQIRGANSGANGSDRNRAKASEALAA